MKKIGECTLLPKKTPTNQTTERRLQAELRTLKRRKSDFFLSALVSAGSEPVP